MNFTEVRYFRSSLFRRFSSAVAPHDSYPRFRPLRDSGPAEAGGFASDIIMRTRNHAHTRGQSHQWRIGLTAWTGYGERRTSNIGCPSCSVSSSIIRDVLAFFSIVSATSGVFIGWLRHQSTSHVLGLLAYLSELTLVILVPILLCTVCPIGCFLLQHGRDNLCELVGRGRRRFGWPQCAAHAAIKRSERAGARAETLGSHAQGATGPIVDTPTARGEHFATTHLVIGTKA